MRKMLFTFVAVFVLTAGTTVATAQMRNGQGNGRDQSQTQTIGKRNGNGNGQGIGRGNGGQRQGRRLGPQDGSGPICSPGTGRASGTGPASPAQ